MYETIQQMCHIKAVMEFETGTSVEVVNAPENLAELCRNCHWEFDHGEIDVSIVAFANAAWIESVKTHDNTEHIHLNKFFKQNHAVKQ